ncbi:MAG: DUF4124 domain-containing protein, partial [Pseudomonadota bacterium]|nr:DUF4124 domain-containing protein [Pseudomonadota bacterium]
MRCLPAMLCLALSASIAPVAAQTEIHRCVGVNGSAVFTDQPCAALQATPVQVAPVAVERIAASVPPPILCAANRAELRQSVIDAFANRDANRMAGLMLWSGYGRGAVIAQIRAL